MHGVSHRSRGSAVLERVELAEFGGIKPGQPGFCDSDYHRRARIILTVSGLGMKKNKISNLRVENIAVHSEEGHLSFTLGTHRRGELLQALDCHLRVWKIEKPLLRRFLWFKFSKNRRSIGVKY